MIKKIRENLIGGITVLLLFINTLFWACFLYPITVLKLIFRFEAATRLFNFLLDGIAQTWIACNNLGLRVTRRIHWDIEGDEDLSRKRWYLVLSNHQSWTDIVTLQKVLHRKTPFIKFFLKKELIWVPMLGLAWWALDFPFMKRYSASFLEKNPHLKGKDIEITRRACAKYRQLPVSVMNFVEGTRFTPQKHRKQKSPHRHLLRPKAGGVGFVLSALGEYLTGILNVTIAYPEGRRSFWDFLCGRVKKISVRIETLPVTKELLGDYINDSAYREAFQNWLNNLWAEKDMLLETLIGKSKIAGCRMSPLVGAVASENELVQ